MHPMAQLGQMMTEVKSASGRWLIQPELIPVFVALAPGNISTPPWIGCQSIAGLPPPPPSIKFAVTHLYTWVERGTVRVKCPAKNTTQYSRSVLAPGPLDLESSALTSRPSDLHNLTYTLIFPIIGLDEHASAKRKINWNQTNASSMVCLRPWFWMFIFTENSLSILQAFS